MSERRVGCFFYGLFMDTAVLREYGVSGAEPHAAWIDDFALRIGYRATLVPAPGARAYGMLIALTHAELQRLYGAPGLEPYRPEAVLVQRLDGSARIPALCYNLIEEPQASERNPAYAHRLQRILRELEFPADYVESVGRE